MVSFFCGVQMLFLSVERKLTEHHRKFLSVRSHLLLGQFTWGSQHLLSMSVCFVSYSCNCLLNLVIMFIKVQVLSTVIQDLLSSFIVVENERIKTDCGCRTAGNCSWGKNMWLPEGNVWTKGSDNGEATSLLKHGSHS